MYIYIYIYIYIHIHIYIYIYIYFFVVWLTESSIPGCPVFALAVRIPPEALKEADA